MRYQNIKKLTFLTIVFLALCITAPLVNSYTGDITATPVLGQEFSYSADVLSTIKWSNVTNASSVWLVSHLYSGSSLMKVYAPFLVSKASGSITLKIFASFFQQQKPTNYDFEHTLVKCSSGSTSTINSCMNNPSNIIARTRNFFKHK